MTAAGRVRSFILPVVRTARLLVPAVLLVVTSPTRPATPPPVTGAPSAQEEMANVRREVRLRKLHLVRPDLIQYPLSYDVYC